MKNKKLTTALALSLVGVTALGSIAPIAAEVTETQTVSANETASTDIIINGGTSTFDVTIPKAMSGSGKDGSLAYSVKVHGDIAGEDIINVVPDSEMTLSQTGKADVIATISQEKDSFTGKELFEAAGNTINTTGAVDYSGLTAGTWNGIFNFNINLETGEVSETVKKTYHIENYSPYIIDEDGTLTGFNYPSMYSDEYDKDFNAYNRKIGKPIYDDYDSWEEYSEAYDEYRRKIGEPIYDDYDSWEEYNEAHVEYCREKGIPVYDDYDSGEEYYEACEAYDRKIGKPVSADYKNDNYDECYALYKATVEGDVILPDSIKKIAGINLYVENITTSLTIPNSVTEIIDNDFGGANVIYHGDIDITQYNNTITQLNGYFAITKDVEYELDDVNNTIKIVKYTGNTQEFKKLIFKDTYTIDGKEYTLTEIEEYAFWCAYNVEELVIPDSVTTIGRYAFGRIGMNAFGHMGRYKIKVTIGSGLVDAEGMGDGVLIPKKNVINNSQIDINSLFLVYDYITEDGTAMLENGYLLHFSPYYIDSENIYNVVIPDETKYIDCYNFITANYGDSIPYITYKGVEYYSKSELLSALKENNVKFVYGRNLEEASDDDVLWGLGNTGLTD